MAALQDISDIINRATGGNSGTPQQINVFKDNRANGVAMVSVAGRGTSYWRAIGSPSHGLAPGALLIPDNTTDGAIKQTDPGGGREKWMTAASICSTQIGTLIMLDRLAQIGGLVGNVTTVQNTTSLAASRYTGASSVGNEIFIEVTTAIGATATTVTATYTDQDGNSQTTQATPIGGVGLQEVNRLIPLPLAVGSTGVRSVQSIQLAATSGTAGDVAVLICRRLATFGYPVAGTCCQRDFVVSTPGPIKIVDGSAIFFSWVASGTTPPQLYGQINFVEA